jgi:uncharacterized membrane protein
VFEFLFKYQWAVFERGRFVLASGWPIWLLIGLAVAASLGVLWMLRRSAWQKRRLAALAALEGGALELLLLLLWRPALSVSSLKPQQNVIAVIVDGSKSMARPGSSPMSSKPRLDEAKSLLAGGLIDDLKKRFPIRLYEAGSRMQRVDSAERIRPEQNATRLGDALRDVVAEAATLPVGGVVLLTDGAENSGGFDGNVMRALKRSRIPVHPVGFGLDRMENDLELMEAEMPARSLPQSRLAATVTLRQSGFSGKTVRLEVLDGGKRLGSRDVVMGEDGIAQRELIPFQASAAGARTIEVSAVALDGETNRENNRRRRLLVVENRKPRILYIEGEPRWELKFIRRALEEDSNVDIVSILRTTQNKYYRQGVKDPKELEQGFPATVDELFAYEGLIVGCIEAGAFTPAQQSLIREFVDRRGGGLLFLGGRTSLSDGGWNRTGVAEVLPVTLADRKSTFRREPAKVELTAAGRDSLITRLEDIPDKNAARWKLMPALADYQDTGAPKPGAVVLLEARAAGRALPLLTVQNYGRGRVALLATGGSWKWQMLQDSKDQTHETFWRQMARFLVESTPGRAQLALDSSSYSDRSRVKARFQVRDRNHLPAPEAQVEMRLIAPSGTSAPLSSVPDTAEPGAFQSEFEASESGTYVLEAVARDESGEIGRDVISFLREDGVEENFRTEQNRELLERLAQETGGRYWRPGQTGGIGEAISLSEAGISVKETRELWDAPAALLLLAGLKTAAWLLRRRWGAV